MYILVTIPWLVWRTASGVMDLLHVISSVQATLVSSEICRGNVNC